MQVAAQPEKQKAGLRSLPGNVWVVLMIWSVIVRGRPLPLTSVNTNSSFTASLCDGGELGAGAGEGDKGYRR